MFGTSQRSTAKAEVLLLALVCCHLNLFFLDAIPGPKRYFHYNSPLYPSVYRVVRGFLTGIHKTFDDYSHDIIEKNDQFTVLVNFTLPLYNKERQWYEIAARICYGKDIEGCVNQTRPFSNPYLVRPSSEEIPVPFVIPFSKMHNASLPNGKTVYEAGTVHEQFKTFEVNGAKYDTSTGILVSFSAKSPQKEGKISGIDFLRDKGKVLRNQPLVECFLPEWASDGCVPGLDNVMSGYDVKFMQLKTRRWLRAVKFPNHRNDKYRQTLNIPGIGPKNYLVFKDMVLDELPPIAKPFSHLFTSVEEQVNTTLKSVGLEFSKGLFLASGKYQSYSKHYKKDSYSAAMSGIEFRLYRAMMSKTYLEDEANWDDGFKKELKMMFDRRSTGNAMEFFRKYGTHYVVKTVMGGRQEAVFTVNYCEVSKENKTKKEFEATLIKPYKCYSSKVGIQACCCSDTRNHSLSKSIISGPQITCTGGNSLDLEICRNVTLWKSTVLTNPYPIEMALKPFYHLVKDPDDRLWLEDKYKEYMKADLDDSNIKSKLSCSSPTNQVPSVQTGHEDSAMWQWVVASIISAISGIGLLICVLKVIKRKAKNRCMAKDLVTNLV